MEISVAKNESGAPKSPASTVMPNRSVHHFGDFFLLVIRRRRIGVDEGQLVVGNRNLDRATLRQLAEQQFLGQRLLDVLLDYAGQRTSAIKRIVALLPQPLTRFVGQFDRYATVGKLRFQLD